MQSTIRADRSFDLRSSLEEQFLLKFSESPQRRAQIRIQQQAVTKLYSSSPHAYGMASTSGHRLEFLSYCVPSDLTNANDAKIWTPFDRDTEQIRLVKLLPMYTAEFFDELCFEMAIFDIASAPPYTALSYAWVSGLLML